MGLKQIEEKINDQGVVTKNTEQPNDSQELIWYEGRVVMEEIKNRCIGPLDAFWDFVVPATSSCRPQEANTLRWHDRRTRRMARQSRRDMCVEWEEANDINSILESAPFRQIFWLYLSRWQTMAEEPWKLDGRGKNIWNGWKGIWTGLLRKRWWAWQTIFGVFFFLALNLQIPRSSSVYQTNHQQFISTNCSGSPSTTQTKVTIKCISVRERLHRRIRCISEVPCQSSPTVKNNNTENRCTIQAVPLLMPHLHEIDRLIGATGWNNKGRTRSGDHLSFILFPLLLNRLCNGDDDVRDDEGRRHLAFSGRPLLKPVWYNWMG